MKIHQKKPLPVSLLAVVFSFFASTTVFADGAVFAPNGPTYVPVQGDAGAASTALNSSLNPSTGPNPIIIPTPDSLGNPLKSDTKTSTVTGQYRNGDNTIKLTKMLLNRFKEAVVRVRALDADGNELGRAMGFGVGHPPEQYIVTPLSLLLGNSQQWAEKIEITHASGNQYTAKISLVNEELNIVLLKPEINPIQIALARSEDERPQIEVFTIALDEGEGNKVNPTIEKSTLAAVNEEEGTLSIASQITQTMSDDETNAGTAIINTQGELIGMLLPNHRGVLASMIQRLMGRTHELPPIEPRMLGVIMGRGVLVDPNSDQKTVGVYNSISGALSAVEKKEAPKIDASRFIKANTSQFKPKESDKIVIKVLPGTYREKASLQVPSNISLAGSGAKQTLLLGTSPTMPVIYINRARNILVSALRVVPAPLQQSQNAAVYIDSSSDIRLVGNVFEAKGGTALRAKNSQGVLFVGNSFPNSRRIAADCENSSMVVESNAFLGDWEAAISAGKNCRAIIKRNLFMQNKISVATSNQTNKINIDSNSFIKSVAGVRTSGNNALLSIEDNIFYENLYAVYSSGDLPAKTMGRNAAWKSRFQIKGHVIKDIDVVRSEPYFENPALYDFRIKLGRGQLGAAAQQSGADLGAFQRNDFLGPFTAQFIHSLESATGRSNLAKSWGYQE